MHNFITTDIETGGFEVDTHQITEFAFIALDGRTLEEIGRYETLVAPYDDLQISESAIGVNGITPTLCEKEGKSVETVFKEICAFLKKHRVPGKYSNRYPVFVAHNNAFERRFYEHFFNRFDVNLYDYIQNHMEDTMHLCRNMWPDAGSVQLIKCCKKIGIELIDAHRAMKDAEATAEVFKYTTASLRNSTNIEVKSLGSSKARNFKFEF